MATAVPLWPPALGGCKRACPKGAGHRAVHPGAGGRAASSTQRIMYSTAMPVSRQHMGNCGPRTCVRLCQPMLISGKPLLRKSARSKAQQTAWAVKGSASPSYGIGAKEKGDSASPATQMYTWAKPAHGIPVPSLKCGLYGGRSKPIFKDKAINTCEQHILFVTGKKCREAH